MADDKMKNSDGGLDNPLFDWIPLDMRTKIINIYPTVLSSVARDIVKHGGDKEEAYDVTNKAFLIVIEQMIREGDYTRYHKLEGYVHKVAINLWLKSKKIKIKNVDDSELVNTAVETELTEEEHQLEHNQREAVLSVLQSKKWLGSKCWRIIIGKHRDGRSHEDMADEENRDGQNHEYSTDEEKVTKETMRTRLNRCMNKLRLETIRLYPNLFPPDFFKSKDKKKEKKDE